MSKISLKDFKKDGLTLEDYINKTAKNKVVLGILELGDNPELRIKCIQKECITLIGYPPSDIWYFKHCDINGLFVIVHRVKPGSKMECGLRMCGFNTP